MSLELNLKHYVVLAISTFANSSLVYANNIIETPRLLTHIGVFSSPKGLGIISQCKDNSVSSD